MASNLVSDQNKGLHDTRDWEHRLFKFQLWKQTLTCGAYLLHSRDMTTQFNLFSNAILLIPQFSVATSVWLRDWWIQSIRPDPTTSDTKMSCVWGYAWRIIMVLDRVIGLTDPQSNSYLQTIQRYSWFTYFPVHRCTRTRILSFY
jgi:hypothetical protein